MTEPAAPVFPADRYGRRREPRRTPRWLPFALITPVVLGMLYLALHLYARYGTDQYQPSVIGYTNISDREITVNFRVHKPGGRTAICRLQARGRSGAEVGYAEVPVGPGTDVTVGYPLATRARALAVDILGCHGAPR